MTDGDAARGELGFRHVEREPEERRAQEEPAPRRPATRWRSTPRRARRSCGRRGSRPRPARARVTRRAELRRVLEELLEPVAVPARPRRPTVPAEVDRDRRDPLVGPGVHHVQVAPAVLGVAVEDADRRARRPLGRRADQ